MIFVSYSRRDREALQRFVNDIESLDPWYDAELVGGEIWWDELLEQIREAELFVFLLSRASAESEACRAELAYAQEVHRPVLPISVDDVPMELAPTSISERDVIELGDDTAANLSAVVKVVMSLQPTELPSPLPPRPPAPFTDLRHLADALRSDAMSVAQQESVLREIRDHAARVDLQPAVAALVNTFLERRSRDLVAHVEAELIELHAASVRSKVSDDDRIRRADLISTVASRLRQAPDLPVTPIVGAGLTDALVGTRPEIASWLADRAEFPFSSYRRNDLAAVSQFVEVMRKRQYLNAQLEHYLRDRLGRILGEDRSTAGTVDEALEAAWLSTSGHSPADPYRVLAEMKCPIYVNAHPWGLLTRALTAAGKQPRVEVCRWKPDQRGWPTSVFETEPDYVPSVKSPLVFHVFGALAHPRTLVLTEDDHLNFVMGVTGDSPVLPEPVRVALADSALILLGFDLERLDVRVLLTLVAGQEGADLLGDHDHVAAQVDPPAGARLRKRMQEYLQTYVGRTTTQPNIDIYWGTVEDFCADLHLETEGARSS